MNDHLTLSVFGRIGKVGQGAGRLIEIVRRSDLDAQGAIRNAVREIVKVSV
jgi:hypothetical protein